ncbi:MULTISPECIES: M48 family metallopeptidase [unclassified Flavobacterium]|uniref:M48 family metallopeptidase n=1 Tax=unclassified Flavobacterium TaxID=196869 RepID=UPI00360B6D8D
MVQLVKLAFFYEIENVNKFTLLVKLGSIAGSVMLLLFTLKFIVKLKNVKPQNRIKLKKEENPLIFDFIHQICKETGAPKPKSIYIDPDVNAYVRYTNVWLSLLLPTRKELTIGLGLVSSLNLSEFKAVMAHEFGHFSQRSMKIGSYIHSANTIIYDMIYDRDKWDEILEQWRNSDFRLSAAAWVITPIIWIIRKTLELFYMFLNLMHSSLSREMEFNADKVAVKSAGSLAIVSALWKLDFGFSYWETILNNAYYASKKEIFTDNLYHHKLNYAQKNLPHLEEKFENLSVEENGVRKFFNADEHSSVSMYSSHPPNDQREKSAKTPFVECDEDQRSPWILFSKEEEIQKEMTKFIYDKYFGLQPEVFVNHNEFENFIELESRNLNLVNEYQNTFQFRFINLPELNSLEQNDIFEGDFKKRVELLKEELTVLMEPVVNIEEKMNLAIQISNDETKIKSLEYKNTHYNKKNIIEAYNMMFNDREELFTTTFKEWDEKFIKSHYRLAKKYNKDNEYKKLLTQHSKIINVYKKLIEVKNQIITEINILQAKSDVTPSEVTSLSEDIIHFCLKINDEINNIDENSFVMISNIDSVQELKDAFIDGGLIKKETGNIFENGGLDRIMFAIENGIVNSNRIENKNLDEVLKFNNDLVLLET